DWSSDVCSSDLLIFKPKFIPFYPKLLELGLSHLEILLFGFIDFYISDGGTGRFYFTNEQLAQTLGCSTDTISRSISKLEKSGLILTHRKIKAGGGQIRFIELSTPQTPKSDYEKTTSLTTKKLQTNNNKINNNNKRKYIKEKKSTPVELYTSKEFYTEIMAIDPFTNYDISYKDFQSYYPKIKDYESSKGKRYKDYKATIRNWLRNDIQKGVYPKFRSHHERMVAFHAKGLEHLLPENER